MATRSTPSRRRHNNVKENMYFEPGKQGRRTGITLKDTGIRDEYGLEPVSGIFSSPIPSPQRSPDRNNSNNAQTNAPAPASPEKLSLRRTPHLPPKTATPRHTNIGGSPVRHSSVRPTPRHASPAHPLAVQSDGANRKLDFSNKPHPVVATVEQSPSPFKPRPARSRKSIFNFDDSPVKRVNPARSNSAELEQTVQEAQDVVDQLLGDVVDDATAGAPVDNPSAPPPEDDDDDMQYDDETESVPQSNNNNETEAVASSSAQATSSNSKRKREQLGTSRGITVETPSKSLLESHSKRRKSVERQQTEHTLADHTEYTVAADQTEYTVADQTEYTVAEPTEHTVADPTEYTIADQTRHTVADPTEYTVADPTEYTEVSVQEPTLRDEETAAAPELPTRHRKSLQRTRHHSPEEEEEDAISSAEEFVPPPETDHEQDQDQPESQPKKRGRGRPKGRKSVTSAPVERAAGSEEPKKRGPRSIVALRSGTPQEDEGAIRTRSGRTSIRPFEYWRNEGIDWRNGEVAGIIRAQEVNESKPKRPSRARGKSKKKTALGSIKEDEGEEEEDEELLPEAWEDELGVINASVRTWDAEMGVGIPDDQFHEDIAFASNAIVPRPVQDSGFRYAKVMTHPFFGAGMVEVPPEGFKRMKNSRRMQMVFFVHQGKVTVEVGDVKFGMSKGGVWQVPRGNNYAILNESTRHTAKVFFAQGCEVEAGVDEAGPA